MEKRTQLDIEESLGDWFDFFTSQVDTKTDETTYNDPEPDCGRACIRPMGSFFREKQRARKISHSFELNTRTRAMERVPFFKQTPEEEAVELEDGFDYAIVDLENFFDAKGSPIECTRENKLKLVAVPMFDRFLARCFEIQRSGKAAEAKVIEKNSPTP